jgi:hypothetical protein
LIDTELPLHRWRRQADLVTDDPASPRQRVFGEQALYRIGRRDVVVAQNVTNGLARQRSGGGRDQPVRGLAQTSCGDGHWGWPFGFWTKGRQPMLLPPLT